MTASDRRNAHNGLMDALTLFDLVAVTLMLVTYVPAVTLTLPNLLMPGK